MHFNAMMQFSLFLSKLYFLLIKILKNPKKMQNFTKSTQVDYKKKSNRY